MPIFAAIKNAWVVLFVAFAALYVASIHVSDGTYGSYYYDFANLYRGCLGEKYGFTVGRDVFDYYGDLACELYKPVAIAGGAHFFFYVAFMALMHSAFVTGLFMFARRAKAWGSASAIFFIVTCFMSRSVNPEIQDLIYPSVFLIFLFEDFKRSRGRLFFIPAFLAALMLFVKFNQGIIFGLIVMLHLAARHCLKSEPWGSLLAKFGLYVVSAVVLGALLIGSPEKLILNFSVLGKMVGAYAVQYSLPAPNGNVEIALAAAVMALLFPIGILVAKENSVLTACYWSLAIGLMTFEAFKHAFIGQMWHLPFFVNFVPFYFSTALYFVRLQRIAAILCAAVLLSCLLFSFRGGHPPHPFDGLRSIRAQGLRTLFNAKSAYQEAVLKNERFVESGYEGFFYAGAPLSDETIKIIGDETVDTVRHYIPYIDRAGLKFKPSPFDFFTLPVTEQNDRGKASHFAGPDAPAYFILSWEGRDGAHPLFYSPATVISLLENYEFAAQEDGYLLLRKRHARPLERKHFGTFYGTWGDDVPIPASDRMVVAEIRTALSLKGHLLKLFFRITRTMISLVTDEGNYHAFMFLTTSSPNGLIVSKLPLSLNEIRPLFENGTFHPMTNRRVAFRLAESGGIGCFKKTFRVDFYEIGFEPTPSAASATTPEEYLSGLEEVPLKRLDHFVDTARIVLPPDAAGNKMGNKPVVLMSGWATDLDSSKSWRDLVIEISGKLYIPLRDFRPDVAAGRGAPGLGNAGFLLKTAVAEITGPDYRIYIRHRDGTTYRVIEAAFQNTDEFDFKAAVATPPSDLSPREYLLGLEKVEFEGHHHYVDSAIFRPADQSAGFPSSVHMHGWAADMDKVSSYRDLAIEISGKLYIPARHLRSDVAQGAPDLINSGFFLNAFGLTDKDLRYKLYIRHRDNKTYRSYEGEIH